MKRPELTPRRILIGGWVVALLYAWPGYLRVDGADQLVDSRTGVFTDWHSPVMTEVWRIVGRAIAGPAGMLLLQSGLLLFGAYAVFRRVLRRDRSAAWAAVGVSLFPPVLATTGVISAEAQLAGWFVAGIGALMSDRRRIRLVGLGLFALGIGMRDGVALVALPLLVVLFHWRGEQGWRRLVLAVLAWVAIVALSIGVERLLVDQHTRRFEVELATSDITEILRRGPTMSDRELTNLLAGTPLVTPTGIQAKAKTHEPLFDAPSTDAQRVAMVDARHAMIRAAPGAYLRTSWHRLYRELGLPRSRNWKSLYIKFVEVPAHSETLAYRASHSKVQRWLIVPVRLLSRTFVFRPYLYAYLGVVLLGIALAWRRRLVVAVLVSGALSELALGFVSPFPAYRDSHWMIVAVVISTVLLGAHRLQTRDERVDQQTASGRTRDDAV